MIIYHQENVAAFAGNHTWYFQFQPILQSRISATSAVPAGAIINQLQQSNMGADLYDGTLQ